MKGDGRTAERLYGKGGGDSAFCRIALLGFAIPFNNVAAIHAGDNQRD